MVLLVYDRHSSRQQAQYGRPPGIKDVLYDERGNVVAVMKISPDKLPSHRYVIIKGDIEARFITYYLSVSARVVIGQFSGPYSTVRPAKFETFLSRAPD